MSSNEKKIPIIELFGPTVQGEGLLIGRPTHFLRTGGCSFACQWCDSMHAVDAEQVKVNRKMMTCGQIYESLHHLPRAPWLTLTGGDPCMWPLTELIHYTRHNLNSAVNVETQGVLFPDWLHEVDHITFSPKGPSSKMDQSITEFRDKLIQHRQTTPGGNGSESGQLITIKIVVFTEEDLSYAIGAFRALSGYRLYDHFTFQVGSPLTPDIVGIAQSIMDEWHGKTTDLTPEKLAIVKRQVILRRYEWLVESVLQRCPDLLTHNVSILPQQHVLLWPLEEKGR